MKEITKTSRLAGSLEKLFSKINAFWFNGELDVPVITIQSTPKAYGHYTAYSAWNVKGEGRREINLGAGTLDRPIEYTVATLMHEMCHMYADTVLNVQDTSNRGIYHNRIFKEIAEAHGLIVERSDKYGWSHTSPADALIEWILETGVDEIKLVRDEGYGVRVSGGHAANGGAKPTGGKTKSNSIRWSCPKCGAIVRSTKEVRIICGDCLIPFIQG